MLARLQVSSCWGRIVDLCCYAAVYALPQVWEGAGVVASARKLIGATNPLAAEPGTIRGDFAIEVGRNIVHGSDSVENGERETGTWLGAVKWSRACGACYAVMGG